MVVITGEPRSGTSLMMRIIDSLFIEIAGEKRNQSHSKKKEERANYLNPEGFWETEVVTRGIRTEEELEKYKDKAIKIITSGLLRTVKPAIDEIDKIIFCLRNPREIIQSQTKLVSKVMVANKNDWKFAPEQMKTNFNRYILSVGRYILQSKDLWNKTLVVDYGELIEDPDTQIKRISEFLEVPHNPESMSIIRKDLYRSIQSPKKDELAYDIYNSVKVKKFSEEVIEEIREFIEELRIKKVTWLDDTEFKTWVIAGWNLHRSLAIKEKLRNTLIESISQRSLPIECGYYDSTGSDYTIKRVEDLGDLTRSTIKCSDKNEEVTREKCFNCWERKKMGEKI